MLLTVITVAFRNHEGVVKTWQSLAHLAKAQDIAIVTGKQIGRAHV